MANEWPANGVEDWNTKMLANLAVAHDTEGNRIYDVNGSPVAVFTKYLTSSFADSVASFNVAHNITDALTKILALDVKLIYSNEIYAGQTHGTHTFSFSADATNVKVQDINGSAQAAGGTYLIELTYIL
jgi:hypothetical protein